MSRPPRSPGSPRRPSPLVELPSRHDDWQGPPAEQRAGYLALPAHRNGTTKINPLNHNHRGEFSVGWAIKAKDRVRPPVRSPHVTFHTAWAIFTWLGLPLDAGQVNLASARAHAPSSPQLAIAEAGAALAEFDRVGATVLADTAAALLRSPGVARRSVPRSGAELRREQEVMHLVPSGCSSAARPPRITSAACWASSATGTGPRPSPTSHVSRIITDPHQRRWRAARLATSRSRRARGSPRTPATAATTPCRGSAR